MKRKFTRIITTLLMLLVSVFTLACCGVGDGGSSSTGSSSTSSSSSGDNGTAYWISLNVDAEQTVDMFVGDQFTLTAELKQGNSKVDDVTFAWSSLNGDVATVSNGVITGVAKGTCEIAVIAVGYAVEETVQVNVCDALTLDLSKQSVELAKLNLAGYTTEMQVEYEVKWQEQIVSDAEISLLTDNDNVVATVSGGKILLTANKIGETVVTAKCVYQSKEVETFITVAVVKPYVESGETYLFSAGKQNTIDLTLLDATKDFDADSITAVYAGETQFPITEKNGSVVTISETKSLGLDGTVETPVTIECAEIRVGVNFIGYTHVIRSAQDFDYMKNFLEDTAVTAASQSEIPYAKKITGYYILANDIDFATAYPNGYNSPFSYINVGYVNSGWSYGWMGTFDGNGYTISNLKLIRSTVEAGAWANSLFGIIAGGGGVVKDVAFKNCSLGESLYDSAFFANMVYGVVENVFLDVALNNPTGNEAGNSAFVGWAGDFGIKSNAEETKISNVTVLVRNALGKYDYVAKASEAGWQKNVKGPFVVIGGNSEKNIIKGYSTISAATSVNEYLKAYTTLAGAADDTTLTACGDATFSKANGNFKISWNGKTVYQDNIVYDLEEALYSLEDKKIDFAKLGITVDSNTTITRNGSAVNFTLNDQVATINSDSVLTAKAQSATGKVEVLRITCGELKYDLPVRVCSDVIYSATDFDNMKNFLESVQVVIDKNGTTKTGKKITGYYILGSDINFAETYADGYASPFGYHDIGAISPAYAHGWKATFEGNNHVISNLKLIKSTSSGGTWQTSLFGYIAGNNADNAPGIVRNVAFKNCSIDAKMYNCAFLANKVFGIVENVYLEVTMTTTNHATHGNAAFVGMDTGLGVMSTDSATKISNVTVVVHGTFSAKDCIMKGATAGLASVKGAIVVIFDGVTGATEANVFEGVATISALTTANTNFKCNMSVGTASGANLAACGLSTFTTTNNVFTVLWNGKGIYTKTLA